MPYVPNDDELDIQLAGAKTTETGEASLIVDVFHDNGDIVVQATVPGATPKDLDLSILNDMVTIKGSRSPQTRVVSQNYYYQELYWGPFSRSIILPEEVDPDGAKANLEHGILTIRLPTLQKSKTRKLTIELK